MGTRGELLAAFDKAKRKEFQLAMACQHVDIINQLIVLDLIAIARETHPGLQDAKRIFANFMRSRQ